MSSLSIGTRHHGYFLLSLRCSELRIIPDVLSQSQSGDVREILSDLWVTVAHQTSRMEHQVSCW